MNQSPWPLRLLDRLLPDDLRHLAGDLEEEYRRNLREGDGRRALLRLCMQVARSLPFFLGQTLKWNVVMILHYLKTGFRVSRKHLSFSLINVVGLAASMAVCLLILLFIVDQKSYDRFHPQSDRIYRVVTDYKSSSNTGSSLYATTPSSLARILRENYTGVEQAVHIRESFHEELRYGGETLSLGGIYTHPEFLELFGFELLHGNPETALSEPGSILLSAENARRLFGEDTDPVGQTLSAIEGRTYTVTGVIDTDVRTHMDFDAVVPFSTVEDDTGWESGSGEWTSTIYNSFTYLRLAPGAHDRLQAQLPGLVERNYVDSEGESVIREMRLQPITGIALGPNLSNELGIVMPGLIAWFLAGFAAVIILIACFNYVSLTVARGLTRSREVGVRKVMGALPSSILKQFLVESVLISVLALLFALGLLNWLLPQFNSLYFMGMTESQIGRDLLADYGTYVLFLFFSIFIGILAGLYPAWHFTRYQPARVLKGTGTGGGGRPRQTLKKVITVTQFTFSIIFIITSIVLYQQFRYISTTDYGFDEERVLNVDLQDVPYDRMRASLLAQPEVISVGATSVVPALGSIRGAWMVSDSTGQRMRGHHFSVDSSFITTMGIQLLAGRNFNHNLASDSLHAAILGRSAVRALGLQSPAQALGASVTINDTECTVIGVIEDFVSADPTRIGDPIVLRWRPSYFGNAVVKVREGGMEALNGKLEGLWAEAGSSYAPRYEPFAEQLAQSSNVLIFRDFIKIFGLTALFSVLISCLGLLGMAMYAAENRVKEIGIRKVLGATRRQLVLLLSREYLVLIGIAVLIGTPLAWAANSLILSLMSNSISLEPVVFLAGILATMATALLTVTSQTLRATRVKVVDNLRSE